MTALQADMDARIAARHADIIGKPPRIPPLDRASVAEAVQAATNALRGDIVGDRAPLPLDAIPEIMFTLCRYPEIWDRIMALSMQVQGRGALPARDRQLAILRTAWLLKAPYEWGEHVKHSRHIGFSSGDIERAMVGSSDPGWTPHERAIMTAAEELRSNAMVTDETWAILKETYGDHQIFELLVLMGQFTSVAYFQNSLRLRLEPGNAGLAAR